MSTNFRLSTVQEEVDEARKLAEEWELKYKEMQRQMEMLDGGGGAMFGGGKKASTADKPT